ncbi:DUF5424 family protein [Rickettsia endosymbiont of Pantilius tunicatus]|uniref:DUF5424 family protein n=1 Tax=Rickettsia endosymbiont of Pantilius tunicatus TaxID=3066267 RepID=UPI0030E35F2D
MSYNQEGYEFKITQAFNCLNDAIVLTYSSVVIAKIKGTSKLHEKGTREVGVT